MSANKGIGRDLRRMIRAQWRDVRVLLHESRHTLFLFIAIVLGGGLLLHLGYTFADTGQHPGLALSFYSAFALIFFETVLPFPEPWYLQVLFYAIPVLGLVVIVDGLLHFGTALLDKQARGQKWQIAMAYTYSNHVIICGLGKVGYRVAMELLKLGREVVAIEINPEGRFVEKAQALNIPIIIANARRSENLIKAGVKRADVVIPCTDDELVNLDIALDARELNPHAKIVMRMFDPDLARRVEKGLGIHTAFSTSALAAPSFAAAAMRFKVRHSFYVGDQLLNLSEVVIGPASRLIGWRIGQLEQELDLSVVMYRGATGDDMHPSDQCCLNQGDTVLVIASLDALRHLNELNPIPS